MIRKVQRVVTLAEIPGKGWLWKEHGRQFKWLVRAIQAVRKDDRDAVKNGIDIVTTTITYEPCTDMGRILVKAFTQVK